MKFIFLSLLAIVSSLSFATDRDQIKLYVEADREFQFYLYDYTQQEGTYFFDKELTWAKLSDAGELILNPKLVHAGNHALDLEVKKEAPSWLSLTDDGILFGKPTVGGKEEVLIRVEDGGKTSVYWVILKIKPLGPSFGSFLKVSSGIFLMGSPESEEGRNMDEVLHKVTLTRSFEIQTTEVTQAQWHKITRKNPSRFSKETWCRQQFKQVDGVRMCPNHPVEQVNWNDIQDFLKELNDQDRKYSYRLPTEAEWEYAARGNTQTVYSFGDNSTHLNDYAWYGTMARGCTESVGTKKPNSIGLYDVHGNVDEWVADGYYNSLGTEAQTDPFIESAPYRVTRGGSVHNSKARLLRSAARGYKSTDYRNIFLGFRLVRMPK